MRSLLRGIGAGARYLYKETRDSAPETPWPYIIGMRHILVQEYFAIDLDIVRNVVKSELPKLKDMIESLVGKTGR